VLAVGFCDRALAALLALACVAHSIDGGAGAYRSDGLLAGLLALHASTARAPYLSWAARGRPDPGGGWTFHPATRAIAFFLTIATFAMRLSGAWTPVELADRVLALPAWALLIGYLLDPGRIRARDPAATERLFYDGACGLCQRGVRFVLAEDPTGTRFRFAPLGGETFEREIPADVRATLPDSVVIQRADGALLVRSDAALHVLERLGGLWRVFGTTLRVVPRPVRDFAYDLLARVRLRLFAAPKSACPLGPPAITRRFDA
jgi:predicted DCC family thiol-disulfide oxidoreductase YuxK